MSRGGAERERERGRHRIQSRLQAIHTEPDTEPEPMNYEIMTAKVGHSADLAIQAPCKSE